MNHLKCVIALALFAAGLPASPQSKGNAPPASDAPAAVAYRGVSASMWAEIEAHRASFGDPNDCHARVDAIPTSGGITLKAGADINAALKGHSLVFLAGGTYKLTRPISLDAGKKLIGLQGQSVTIDASAVQEAIYLRDNTVLANVNIRDAIDVGVNFYNASTDAGSSNSLVYQVSVGRVGLSSAPNANGVGFGIWYGATNNCLVSTEAFDTWNEEGSEVTANGGNADGYRNSYRAHHNTFIDSHSYRNGDDGFDFWEGGVAFVYFSSAFENGKTTGKPATGDGDGFKLGRGSVRHYLYRSTAYRNKANGFDVNGNAIQPALVKAESVANGQQDFSGVTR